MALENKLLEDIRTWFEDFAVSFTDLQKPTYIFVRDFYCRALMEFEVDTDNVRMATGLVSDTEVDIAGDINLVSAINRVFKFLEFGLFDLLSPTDSQKRTVNLMSRTIEFIKFADELSINLDFDSYSEWRIELERQEKELEVLKTKVSEVALDKDRLEQENINLQEIILAAKEKKAEKMNALAPLEAEAHAAMKKVQSKRSEFDLVNNEVIKSKNAITRLREAYQGAQTLETREEERKRSEQEKEELLLKYKEKSELKKKLAVILDSIKKHRNLLLEMGQAVDEVTKMQESLTAVQKEIADLKQTAALDQKTLAELVSEEAALEQKEKTMEEELAAFKSVYEDKIDDLTKRSSTLLASVSELQRNIDSEDRLLDSIKKSQKDAEEGFTNIVSRLTQLLRGDLKICRS